MPSHCMLLSSINSFRGPFDSPIEFTQTRKTAGAMNLLVRQAIEEEFLARITGQVEKRPDVAMKKNFGKSLEVLGK